MIDISVNSLVKSFELGKNILDGLSFTIDSGERVGILGHNGCGKTTLFRILTGELPCDEGEVMIAPSKRIGLISQIPVYPEGWTTKGRAEGRSPPSLRHQPAHGRADADDGDGPVPRPAAGV